MNTKKMSVPWSDGGYALSQMVRLLYIPGSEPLSPKRQKSEIHGGEEEDKPHYTPAEEHAMIREQVKNSEGFDIDFSKFRCRFNFNPVDLDDDDFTYEPETDRDLLNKLSKLAVDKYNEEKGTNLEFVEVLKANWHPSAAITFYITFKVRDPPDNQVKLYQAMVRNLNAEDREVYFCRPRICPKGIQK